MSIKKIAITNEVVAQWTKLAIEQLVAGWSESDVRRELTKAGCTPKLLVQILKTAKSHTRAHERRGGIGLLVFGVLLVTAGIAVIAAQKYIFTGTHIIAVPSGAILLGLGCCARGALKSVFG